MRHGRAKAARRTLQFFRLHLGIRSPYHVLLDGTLLLQVVLQKVPLRDRISKMLQHHPYTLYVTRSSLKELEALAEQAPETKKEALRQARQWGLDECDTILEAKDMPNDNVIAPDDTSANDLGLAAKDVLKLVSVKPFYLVASHDEGLLDLLRSLGTAPLMRLSRGVLLLENPSKSSQQKAASQEHKKWFAGSVPKQEKALVETAHQQHKQKNNSEGQASAHTRVKQKAKGPNPLSCKKSKREATKEETASKRKRRRRNKSESVTS